LNDVHDMETVESIKDSNQYNNNIQ